MSANIYYDPEKFGLTTIGEVEFSSGAYEFDTLVLWQDTATPSLFFTAQDSGCSCPSPFESIGRSDLTPITRLQDLLDVLNAAKAESCRYDTDSDYGKQQVAEIDGECAALVGKYREAKAVSA